MPHANKQVRLTPATTAAMLRKVRKRYQVAARLKEVPEDAAAIGDDFVSFTNIQLKSGLGR